ncbi:MAG TPA: diol dehydratase small subunit [Gaiellaceae bacterium]|nr:diol dehydratase small subunit [Gaiellaceae bacterium]
MGFEPTRDYPLGQRRPDLVSTPGGHSLDEVTLEAVVSGRIGADELRATPETLRRQSAIALAAGRTQLADNLARAAELAVVPAETILEIYTALRPHRSSAGELESWAGRLEGEWDAPLTAAFVREAKDVYAKRGLLAGERAQV